MRNLSGNVILYILITVLCKEFFRKTYHVAFASMFVSFMIYLHVFVVISGYMDEVHS